MIRSPVSALTRRLRRQARYESAKSTSFFAISARYSSFVALIIIDDWMIGIMDDQMKTCTVSAVKSE